MDTIEKVELAGSGYVLEKLNAIIVHHSMFKPLKGGSWIDLPKWIKDKKACINIINED